MKLWLILSNSEVLIFFKVCTWSFYSVNKWNQSITLIYTIFLLVLDLLKTLQFWWVKGTNHQMTKMTIISFMGKPHEIWTSILTLNFIVHIPRLNIQCKLNLRHTFTSLISNMAYACVGTSPALSASASEISPVATVTRQWPWWKRSRILLNSLSLSKRSSWSEPLVTEILSGIQPVSAWRSMFWN